MAADDLDQLWQAFSRGEAPARARLLALYYDEFRAIARRVLNGDSGRMHLTLVLLRRFQILSAQRAPER